MEAVPEMVARVFSREVLGSVMATFGLPVS